MDDIAQYLVRNQTQVIKHLKLLKSAKCLITASFGTDGHKGSFITAIVNIDEKNNTVQLDCASKDYLNRYLLESSEIKYLSDYEGIRVKFESKKVRKSGKKEQPTFTIPVPQSIFWFQRRQFYRVHSPMSKKSYCEIRFTIPETEQVRTERFPLHDISIQGLSFINDHPELSAYFAPTIEFKDCTLILDGDTNSYPIHIEVRHKQSITNKTKDQREKVGCQMHHVTPVMEAAFLRYMQGIEREIKQKEL